MWPKIKNLPINEKHISMGIVGTAVVAVIVVCLLAVVLLAGGKLEYDGFKLSAQSIFDKHTEDGNSSKTPPNNMLISVTSKTITDIPQNVRYTVYARGKKDDAVVMGGSANFVTENGELKLENGKRDTMCRNGRIVHFDSPDAIWDSDGIGIVNERQISVHANTATEKGNLQSDFQLTLLRDERGRLIKFYGPITYYDGARKRHRELIIEFIPDTGEHSTFVPEGIPCSRF